MQVAQVEDVYNFYVDEEANGGQVDETTADALKVFSTIESDYGKFQQFKPVNLEDEDDKTIQEVDDKVVVTLYAECAEKEAIVKATFVDNSVTYNFQKYSVMAQNQYSEEEADQMLASNGVYPYKISEFEVAANQTLKDKMKDAGANTLIGMGIVFIALIFISFIISLLKYVPALLDKETREKRKAEKAKKALGSVATLNVDKEDETPAGNAPAPAGIVDIVNTATGVCLYLAIKHGFEPLLLVPIAFGMLLVNIYPDIMLHAEDTANGTGGLLYYFITGRVVYPSFSDLHGCRCDDRLRSADCKPDQFPSGSCSTVWYLCRLLPCNLLDSTEKQAAAISIIGGADGPTSIFLAGKLGQTALMGPIAVAAYSYMSLVPIIQPPIMKLLTTEKERKIKMEQLRPVSKLEKILFPIVVTRSLSA